MQENNFNNIQDFENNFELRKALNKLENELQKKDYELSLITDLYQDLKTLNEKSKKENNDLVIKLNTVRSDMTIMEKKYQNEIDTIKSNFQKEAEIYNNKILKLSEYNPSTLQKNIEYKIENKYKQQLILKDKEIDDLSSKLTQTEHKYQLLLAEYEEYKIDMQKEFDIQKRFHQNEINSLLEKINFNDDKINNMNGEGENNDNYIQIKNELDNTRRHVTELNNEIDKLRHDKELLIIEKNEYKINSIKERDSQNFNNKNIELSLNKANSAIESLNREINMFNNALKERDFQINELLKQKNGLIEKLENYDIENQNTKNMIQQLKKMIEDNEEDNHKKLMEKEKLNKENFFKEQKEKENLQKQIVDLSLKLQDAKNNDKNKKEIIYKGTNKEFKELMIKYQKILKKKNEYKKQCRMANENIEKIIDKLDEEQQGQFQIIIQNTKKKYLENEKFDSDDEK